MTTDELRTWMRALEERDVRIAALEKRLTRLEVMPLQRVTMVTGGGAGGSMNAAPGGGGSTNIVSGGGGGYTQDMARVIGDWKSTGRLP